MEDKLKFLLNEANIGTYNKCEIIEIFGFDKKEKEAFNIYTLVVFENTKQENIKELMTDKLQSFQEHKNLSWGIQRRIVDSERATQLYSQLLKNNKFEIDNPLRIGKMQLLKEQYVPPREDMYDEIQLNYILKNNFHNGSYVLEFFDEEKENIKFLLDNPILLNSFSEQVSEILPLKLANVSDRLGNVVFQFPINCFDIYHASIIQRNPRQYAGISLQIYPKNDFDISSLQARFYENNDNLLTRQKLIDIKSTKTEIEFDDCFGTHIEVVDKDTSLLLYKNMVTIQPSPKKVSKIFKIW